MIDNYNKIFLKLNTFYALFYLLSFIVYLNLLFGTLALCNFLSFCFGFATLNDLITFSSLNPFFALLLVIFLIYLCGTPFMCLILPVACPFLPLTLQPHPLSIIKIIIYTNSNSGCRVSTSSTDFILSME